MFKKLLKSVNNLIILVIIVVILLAVQSYLVRQASNIDAKVTVYVATTDIEANTLIDDKMLRATQRNLIDVPLNYVKSKSDIVGKFAVNNIYRNEELLTNDLKIYKDDFFFNLENTNNQFMSIAFNSDAANGWRLMKDQRVNIIFSPYQVSEGSVLSMPRVIENIRVVDILSETLKSYNINSNEEMGVPKYIIFEVTPDIAEYLTHVKDKGRLEISVLSNKK
jgi:pilus assembly protein CpaB